MRFVGKIAHPDISISVFHMNDKYIVKLEAGPMEQVFKFSSEDVKGMDDIAKIITTDFVKKCHSRFNEMYIQLLESKKNPE